MTSDVRVVAAPTAGHEASDQTHSWEALPSLVQGILAWLRGGVSSAAAAGPASEYAHVEAKVECGDGRGGAARDGNSKRLICPSIAFCPPVALRHDHNQSGVVGCARS
jgi:hypothetical protein